MLIDSKIGKTSFSEKAVLSNLLRRFIPIEDISTKDVDVDDEVIDPMYKKFYSKNSPTIKRAKLRRQ